MKIPTLITRGDRKYYTVTHTIAGRKRIKYFKTPTEAREYQLEVQAQLLKFGNAYNKVLTRQEQAEVLLILQEMEQFGVKLGDVWHEYQTRHDAKRMTCDKAWASFIQDKHDLNLRESTIRGYHCVVPFFVSIGWDRETRDITVQDIKTWFNEKDVAPRSLTKYISVLGDFFNHCIEQGWQTENPTKTLKVPKVDAEPPQCLSNQDVRALLGHPDPTMKPYLIVALYAGLRRTEIERLSWDNIKNGQITLDGHQTKTRRRRVVTMLGDSFNKLMAYDGAEFVPKNYKAMLAQLKHNTGVKWRRDCLRHTAATHMLNVYKSASETSLQLGNSNAVLMNHYKGIATQQQTDEFLSILA